MQKGENNRQAYGSGVDVNDSDEHDIDQSIPNDPSPNFNRDIINQQMRARYNNNINTNLMGAAGFNNISVSSNYQ